MLPDSEIRNILVQRIDDFKQSVGIAIGVVEPEGRRVTTYGALDQGDQRPLNGDTIFEIGSVTKVFTGVLLADMAQRGDVALTDPVTNFLPPGVKMPERNGRSITLLDLATHTSGLPRLPENLTRKDPNNPYADYTVEHFYQFLSTYELTRDIGSQYEYSNLGGGLLGHLLSLRAGMDYETLVQTRICKPLGMRSTAISLSPEMKTCFAVGHHAAMSAASYWDLPTLAGAGALRSTANDMVTFLAANLGYAESPLAMALAATLEQRRPTGMNGLDVGLGWHILRKDESDLIWHNGGTGGFRSFIGFDPKQRIGVVALSNMSTVAGVDDIGMHLLKPSLPLMGPPKAPTEHKEIAVDPKIFDGYVGRYQLTPNFVLTVTREGDRLFAQATAQPKFEIFAEGVRDYFLKVVDAQITFEVDGQGQAMSLTLHQNGRDVPAKRIE